jgi:repressor LexA
MELLTSIKETIMKKLHETQNSLLTLLKDNICDPLTIRELQEELNISSPSVVHHHIQQLEKKGYLRRNPHNPQDYHVLSDEPDKKISYLNMYGLAACGPEGSLLDGNPVDRIPMPTQLLGFQAADAFMIKAKGDSMSPKINDGDLVIARKTNNINNGSIAVCVNNGEAFIKKIQTGSPSLLISLNSDYAPFMAAEDFRVEGEVRGVYSNQF